ncbi:type VI secretion system protein [Klebsiella michiganensis]|uniref:Type VI secretion system protein n=1 Tax=Klebsiella michiganensis TaxID=1134687 RepID=A0A7H4N0C4_9ENTR|nr:type VI secretion system protein [Klebsiella michiganensis]
MPTRHNAPSLYEMLYGNFTGGLDLHQVSEEKPGYSVGAG